MAGVLTLNLVLQKSKVDDIRRVQKLNVCAAQLTDIGILRQASNLEVLSLSLNEISDLGVLSNCQQLREAYLRRNSIRDINQVLHLSRLSYLEVLNLSENPISRDPNYRRFVLAAIPSLERLDDMNISHEERQDAVRVFPELMYFAPPASAYAAPVEGAVPPPQAQPPRNGGAAQRPNQNQNQRPIVHSRPGNAPASRPTSANNNNYAPPPPAPQQRAPPAHQAPTPKKGGAAGYGGGASVVGPSEPGVIQAVKVLCSELSPKGLDEIRRFIDSMSGY